MWADFKYSLYPKEYNLGEKTFPNTKYVYIGRFTYYIYFSNLKD